ncbi:rod shape-determining protein MreC [Cytobacillus spongiae]|jgi:rod shape-determining protein MreC|uniref:rod shape-determining protein MreC n=1 Tax=Cytobacillus spongiae TaxID=2901381 RepID=UPI001F3777C1|nr:rod shape-determining protein MreC [Cytobacillus spongiae]UII55039.1 rod shape-determining protein MreC [Cytobacillus spongiae]
MPQFFLNKRLIILLVSIIILVALIGFSLKSRDQLTWPEQFIKDTTGWVQTVVSRPAHYVAGFFENLEDLQNTYQENKELKKRLDELAVLEANVQELKKENVELRDILDKKDSLRDFEPKQATVIGRDPSQWHELLIINKGKSAGIKADMAVITSNGLIGKVKSSQQFTSTVQLLSAMDPTNRISAKVNGDQTYYGTIEGYDEERKLLMLKKIPYDAKIEKDQTVITSGLGGVFPGGLPIGKVVEVVPDEFGLTQTAYVKPGANLYDIEHVMVVKRQMIEPGVEDKEEEQ